MDRLILQHNLSVYAYAKLRGCTKTRPAQNNYPNERDILMTDFEKTYQNYNPRAAALAEARALLTEAAKAAMADGTLPEAELPAFIVEIPADTKNGDIASNLAMAGARTWRKAPKMIADALLAHLPSIEHSVFAKVEVAGPGFINLFLAPSFWASVVLGACSNKEYGRTDHGKGAKSVSYTHL